MTGPDRDLHAPGARGIDADRTRSVLRARRAEVVAGIGELDASFADIVAAAEGSNLDDEHDPEGATIAVSREQVSALATASHRQIEAIDQALAELRIGVQAKPRLALGFARLQGGRSVVVMDAAVPPATAATTHSATRAVSDTTS
mgnify:CR=1 FL=1